MSNDSPPVVTPELLDDFYAECEEHLIAIREALAGLEAQIGQPRVDATSVEKLFRSIHSLKGISGIVGLRSAERLAHAAEDYIRQLSQGDQVLSPAGFDALFDAVHKFEQIIAGHRAHQPEPDIAGQMAALAAVVLAGAQRSADKPPQAPAPVGAPPPGKQLDDALADKQPLWQCTFVPTSLLDKRGININEVRKRLSAAGEIVSAAPLVRGGTIAFQFIVATRTAEADWGLTPNDGVTIVPYAGSAPAAAGQAAPTGIGATPGAPSHTPFLSPSHVVRVGLPRLDELMRIAGEMVIHRARLDETIEALAAHHKDADCNALTDVSALLARDLREMRDAIMRVRLVPAAEIFSRMPFVVRDLARESGKKVRVTVSGHETQIDKYVVERLKDPLLHLVRNSVSHGIELPQERVAHGKPAEATISLAAATAGDVVVIRVSDDGRGIDQRAIADRAVALGLNVPQVLDPASILELISAPGFSTRDEADRVSGRGVGMSVVSNTVHELGGTIVLETEPGRGATFTLRLPLTLAIIDAIIARAADQTFAVPQAAIEQIIQLNAQDIQRVGRAEIVLHRGAALPLLSIARRFQLATEDQKNCPVLVVSTDRGPVGLLVDRLLGHREVVVRPLRDPLVRVNGFSGATDLGDGKPVLIIDALALTRGMAPGETSTDPALPSV